MKRIIALLLALSLAVAVSACGKKEEKAEAPAPEPQVSNPYATQLQVMDKAKALQAESQKKVAEEQAREAAMAGEAAGK